MLVQKGKKKAIFSVCFHYNSVSLTPGVHTLSFFLHLVSIVVVNRGHSGCLAEHAGDCVTLAASSNFQASSMVLIMDTRLGHPAPSLLFPSYNKCFLSPHFFLSFDFSTHTWGNEKFFFKTERFSAKGFCTYGYRRTFVKCQHGSETQFLPRKIIASNLVVVCFHTGLLHTNQ